MTENIWKYFKRETGIPIYDEMLKNKEYYEREKGICFDIMYMKPKEFLERAADIAGKSVEEMRRMIDTNVIKKYKDLMEKGERFPMLVLDYIRGIHEGRHRALAGELMNLEKLPVMIVYDCEKGCPLEREEKKMTEKVTTWYVGVEGRPVRVIEPNFENIKEGQILIDKSGLKYRIVKIDKTGVPAEWKIDLQCLANENLKPHLTMYGLERHYKIYVGEGEEKQKEELKKKVSPLILKQLRDYEQKFKEGKLDEIGKLYLYYLRKKAGVSK